MKIFLAILLGFFCFAAQGQLLTNKGAIVDTTTLAAGRFSGKLDTAFSFGVYSPSKYGSFQGDGTVDCTNAIQAALNVAKANGGGRVQLPFGTFLITRPLKIGSHVTLSGMGEGATTITKPASVKSLLTVDANQGDHSVTVADASGFTVGGSIHIYDALSFEWVSTQATITGIAGNVLSFNDSTFDSGLDSNVVISRSAAATSSFPLIRNDSSAIAPVLQDLTLNQNYSATDPINDFTLAAIHWVEAIGATVQNVEIINAIGDGYSDQAQDGTNVTPVASLIKTTRNKFINNKISGAKRHGVHLGTFMNGAIVSNNIISNCAGFGVFYCAYVTYTNVTNNLFDTCGSGLAGIDYRDYGNVIAGNIIKRSVNYGIEASTTDGSTGGKLTITNNNIFQAGSGCIYINQPDCSISSNVIDMNNGGNPGIKLGTSAKRNSIVGNTIMNGGAGSQQVLLLSSDDVSLVGNSFTNGRYGVSVRGVNRLTATNNHTTSMASGKYVFETLVSTDCIISGERDSAAGTPVIETITPVRLVYEGLGNNLTTNPASGGDWFFSALPGSTRRYDGVRVYWNDGIDHISIFKQNVGWLDMINGTGGTIGGKLYYSSVAKDTAFDVTSSSVIYASATATTTPAYPFTVNGHLIVQPRTSGARDIILVSGATPAARLVVSGSSAFGVGIGNFGTGTTLGIPSSSLHIKPSTTAINTGQIKLDLRGSAFMTTGERGDFTAASNRLQYTDSTNAKYLIHAGGTPTIAAGAGAGTTPTISITGIDEDGYISITTGTTPTLSATLATITFSSAYPTAPKCIILEPANAAAAALNGGTMIWPDQAGISTTVWTITTGTTALTAATVYKFYYRVHQ